jgi:hypothetical protein
VEISNRQHRFKDTNTKKWLLPLLLLLSYKQQLIRTMLNLRIIKKDTHQPTANITPSKMLIKAAWVTNLCILYVKNRKYKTKLNEPNQADPKVL